MVFTLPKAAEGTTHKKGENKSWASAAAFAGRLLLECLTFTPIKILFLTYLLKVSPHKLNGPAHNELKRRKKFILAGQCIALFASKAKINVFGKNFRVEGPKEGNLE